MEAEPDKLERLLQPTKDRYRLLAENASDVIFTYDLNLLCTYCSPSVERLTGYTVEEVMSKTFEEILTPASCRETKEALEEGLASEKAEPRAPFEPRSLELEVACKGGGIVWAEVKVSFLRDERGHPVGILGVARDVSERKRAEEEALSSRFRLSEAMDLAKIVYWELDPTTGTFLFNDSFYSFYGTCADREGGYRMKVEEYDRRFVHPDDRAMLQESARSIRSGREPEFLVDIEHRIVRRDGEVRHIMARTRGFRDAGGRITRCYGANQDITERKQAEAERAALESQLRQAQRMEAIGTLAGGIAHDFNNVLSAMMGFAKMAKGRVPKGSRQEEHLRSVLNAGLRGKDLVRQMLTFGRKREQEKEPLRMSGVIKEVMKLLRPSIPSTIRIKVKIDSESGPVLADRTQMQQVLMNLCTNATYAMREKGGVLEIGLSDFVVSAGQKGDSMKPGLYTKLYVRDTGAGMDRQTRDRVFDPFFTTKKPGEGTGLGLSVVHGIVKQHGGHISVESEPGKGSTFTVYLAQNSTGGLTSPL